MLGYLRRRLGLKLFLSYVIVILVGVIVLATAAEFAVPSAYERHLASMRGMMDGQNMPGQGMMVPGRTGNGPDLPGSVQEAGPGLDLFTNFSAAVTEALTLAALAAALAAVLVSLLVSRQVVAPVREMVKASKRIAEGHYTERVQVPGNPASGEMDELAMLALSFNQMAARLERTEAIRRQLIGDVAHELRTPLTTLKGSLEGLIDGVLPSDPATLGQLATEADRMGKLVNDLQELSRVEAGAYELNRQPIMINEVVASVSSRLARQFEEKGVALELDIPADLPPVFADEDRLGQVLLNLIGNALQYTPGGGQVRVTASRGDSEVQMSIEDSGIGIPPEHLPHVFDRFYRVDKSRSRAGGGSGIGLTIARYLVEAHGGRIWASSRGPGQGSTFTFSLPSV
jgi:histidine kinase